MEAFERECRHEAAVKILHDRASRKWRAEDEHREMDAAKLRKLPLQASAPVGAVVSGLPFLSMPMRKVHAILEGAFSHLRCGGALYQFTYGPKCPIARPLLDRLGLKARYVGCTLANIPPAAVYRISRRRPRRAFEPAHQDLLFDGQKNPS